MKDASNGKGIKPNRVIGGLFFNLEKLSKICLGQRKVGIVLII